MSHEATNHLNYNTLKPKRRPEFLGVASRSPKIIFYDYCSRVALLHLAQYLVGSKLKMRKKAKVECLRVLDGA